MPGIILPRSATPKFRCRVPTGGGDTCGKPFWDEKEMIRHATRCAREHEQQIHDEAPSAKLPILYDPNLWDPEYEAHMERMGQRLEREGRLVLKPHER